MNWILRAILRAFIWRGVYKLTTPKRKPRGRAAWDDNPDI